MYRKRFFKLFIGMVFSVIIFLLGACGQGDYKYEETKDFAKYETLRNEYVRTSFSIFPEDVDMEHVENFSYVRYNYHSSDIDVYLSLKWETETEFNQCLTDNLEKLQAKYRSLFVSEFILGYDAFFFGELIEFKDEPTLSAYVRNRGDNYSARWYIVMYSRVENRIVFNRLLYQSINKKKFAHMPYITQNLGVQLTQMEFEYRI